MTTNTPTAVTTSRASNQRIRRGSHVRIVVIVPVCHDAPTIDAPITSPITMTMNPAAFTYSPTSPSVTGSPEMNSDTPMFAEQ